MNSDLSQTPFTLLTDKSNKHPRPYVKIFDIKYIRENPPSVYKFNKKVEKRKAKFNLDYHLNAERREKNKLDDTKLNSILKELKKNYIDKNKFKK